MGGMRALSRSGYAGATVAAGLALSLIAVPSFAAGRQDPSTDQPARPTVTVTVTVTPVTGAVPVDAPVTVTAIAPTTAPPPAPTTATTGVRTAAQTLRDLSYAGTSPAQSLDLYLPERTGTAVPLV